MVENQIMKICNQFDGLCRILKEFHQIDHSKILKD